MANGLDNLIDAIETALADLVTAATVKAIVRRRLNPQTEPRVPIVGLYPIALRRQVGQGAKSIWQAAMAIRICTAAKDVASDQAITELIAAVSDRIDTLNVSGSAGGVAETEGWDFWYWPALGLGPVGAGAIYTLRFDGALVTT